MNALHECFTCAADFLSISIFENRVDNFLISALGNASHFYMKAHIPLCYWQTHFIHNSSFTYLKKKKKTFKCKRILVCHIVANFTQNRYFNNRKGLKWDSFKDMFFVMLLMVIKSISFRYMSFWKWGWSNEFIFYAISKMNNYMMQLFLQLCGKFISMRESR